MKKLISTWLIVLVLATAIAQPALAATDLAPQGSCPTGFTIMAFDPNMDHNEHHIGLKTDLNGDGLICMMVLDSGLHVHVDNVLP